MPTYTTCLCSRESKPSDLLLVRLKKPAGFQFRAGQFAELGLIESPVLSLEETFRTFSFVSAPSDPRLEFTMRLSSPAFKTTLSIIALGTKVLLKEPAGTLHLHSGENRPAMFLAGGGRHCSFREHAPTGSTRSSRTFFLYVPLQPLPFRDAVPGGTLRHSSLQGGEP